MTTRAPLTAAEIQYLSKRKQQGATHRQVAEELHCSCETSRKHWRRVRRLQTAPPRGRPACGILSTFSQAVVERALALKRSHPHWGPVNVRLELHKQLPGEAAPLPSASRLGRLFRSQCPEAVQPHRRQHYPDRPPPRVTQAHQRWQIDGKEKVRYGANEVATVLNVRDPVSALIVASQAYRTTTPKGWRKVTHAEVQATLRRAFAEWGLPCEIQSDHEVVYTGSPHSDFPSLFTLWLIGLGLTHVTSRERRPTDQAHVERTHRTLGDLGWKDQASDTLEQLQSQLDGCREHYNRRYPAHTWTCHGEPPLVAHPQAVHTGRPFDPSRERLVFDLARVEAYLSAQVWQRQVSDSGNVGVGDQLYAVGRIWRKQRIAVRYNAVTHCLHFESSDGALIKELPPRGLSQADLIGELPMNLPLLTDFQLPLPLVGV